MNQLQIHKKIDDFLKAGIAIASIEVARELIGYNPDAKRYFFSTATQEWIKWFFENDLFAELKKKADDPTKYAYRLPELEYLTRMAEKEPRLVADVILSVPISKETFNPEVVDRFFWITGLLPIEEIKRILPKVLAENWLKIMSPFSRSGYEYQKMVEKLGEAKDYETLLILAKIILTVRAKEEFANSERFSVSDRLFYLGDISETGIFELITDSDNTKKEESLKLLLGVLTEAVGLGKEREESAFGVTEPFYLLDVDIFTIGINTSKRSYHKEDIKNLIASCKILIQVTLGSACSNEEKARRIYADYIDTLPDSLTCWRLKLYAITRCPALFKAEIEEALFRVFNVRERYFEIDGGAEYHQGLIAGFGSLDEPIQRKYVAKVIEYHGATLEDKDREQWRKRDGLEILTYIQQYLTPDEIVTAEPVFGKILKSGEIVPHPGVGQVTSGMVSHRSPFNPAEQTIDALIDHLKTDATPKALSEQYKGDDFFNPRGAEGLGDAIKEDFKTRRVEYLSNLNKFFDREAIDPGYVYAILRQVEDALRAKEVFPNEQYLQIINFFDVIRQSGELKEFDPADERSHLADWITVHKSMADVLLEILVEMKDSQDFKDSRGKILSIIKYLLSIKSSPDVEDDKRESNEPAHVAINSVRGQAYRAFVQFTYNDGNKTLSDDVKVLYEHVLDTDTSNAVRFTIGQFLASFYFRDIPFIKGLLPKLFPKAEAGKEKLFFATWEGYLASSLYKELFEELAGYYEYAIKTDPDIYPDRKYLKGLDETLAAHIALAYAHFDFNNDNPLFELFWKTPNETRHYEFVSFIGRTCITRSQAGDAWFAENNVSKPKLIGFWDWILATDIKIEPKAFSGFGFWINPDNEVIDEKIIIKNLPLTLEKAEGEVDWDYGLTRRIKVFAEIDPTNTLEVIRHFLLHDGELNSHRRVPLFSVDSEIKEALGIIYKDDALKPNVVELVNQLIEKGSSIFWGLKDILKQQ
ncbi:hypothetical protein A2880_03340 [Candidatus Peribacteria bacterium RIFCSPHIGHO2_01_FULL_49_38]|nr:MAG: hypothetical protein A2880_03340 [Candidatus Peribacteria bacterium RIFCSPHIGHO2_01_FULL_49_38]